MNLSKASGAKFCAAIFFFFVTAVFVAAPLFLASAQSDGTPPPEQGQGSAPSAGGATAPTEPKPTSTTQPQGEPAGIPQGTTTIKTSTSTKGVAPRPITPRPTSSAPATVEPPVGPPPVSAQNPPRNENPDESGSGNTILWAALASLAALVLGYAGAQSLKKGKKTKKAEKRDDSRCFDIKKLMEEKAEELKDLQGRLESKAEEKAREKIRGAVEGTPAAELLALIERAEKEYGRLKKLYEKCILETKAKKNVIILHGTSETKDSFWFPWLIKELEKRGYTVSLPSLPDADNPRLDAWLPVALKETYTPETILIGHSAGGPLQLSVLENIGVKIKRAILVAGYARPKSADPKPEPILQNSYDWRKISEHVDDIIFINSDNDPWGCTDVEGKYMRDNIGKGKLIVMKGEGHMGSDTFKQPYKEFPLLLELIGK